MESLQRILPLSIVAEPLTWAAAHQGTIFAVHARGVTSGIGMETYSFAGEPRGRVPSIRNDVLGAVFSSAQTVLLMTPKRLLVVDLSVKKVTATRAHDFTRPLAIHGRTALFMVGAQLRFDRMSQHGVEEIARLGTKKETMLGAFAASETRWWVWSSTRLARVEVAGSVATIEAAFDLPMAVNDVLVDPARDVAIAMDASLGVAGSTACAVRLSDGHVLARASVPTGRIVWDEEGRAAILDEKQRRVHRLGDALEARETIDVPALVTNRFPVRAEQLSPAEILVSLTPAKAPSSLLHLAWGSGVARAIAR